MKIEIQPVLFTSNSKSSSKAGFSLLELAIVLMILGIIGGISLPLLTSQINRASLVKTRAHQDYTLNAIAAYVDKNGFFPCPADPAATGVHFGVSKVTCKSEEARGIIPFKTLGISEVFAKDGFKRFMTYVVEPELTKIDTALQHEAGGWITIKREEGGSVLSPPHDKDVNPNYVALVLISHGESGIGAYVGNGHMTKRVGDSPSPHKKENFDDNFIFIESSQTDDILRWESRDPFLQNYVHSQ